MKVVYKPTLHNYVVQVHEWDGDWSWRDFERYQTLKEAKDRAKRLANMNLSQSYRVVVDDPEELTPVRIRLFEPASEEGSMVSRCKYDEDWGA